VWRIKISKVTIVKPLENKGNQRKRQAANRFPEKRKGIANKAASQVSKVVICVGIGSFKVLRPENDGEGRPSKSRLGGGR